MKKPRLAIVVSHPIQHFVHFYRALAAREDLVVKVFFCSRIGVEAYLDKDMGTIIRWADDMLSGFDHEFLPEAMRIRGTRRLFLNNPSVAGALNAFGPDAVIIYGYAQPTQLRTLAWCRWNKVPVLMIGDSNAVTKRPGWKMVLRQTVLRMLFSQVTGFLTVGDQNEDLLASLGVPRARMYRCPFTIDEDRYRRARAERSTLSRSVRDLHGIPYDAFVGIVVGKLIARKQTQDAVVAVAQAAKACSGRRKIHLLVCGNGPDMEYLEGIVTSLGSPTTFAGFVNIDRLPDYFAAADVLVHPADRDAHPLICSEAACVGLPMILSDLVGTIGLTDIAREGENTIVFKCGDVSDFAQNIVRLATNDALCQSMGGASIRIFEECSSQASVAGLLTAVMAATRRCRS